MSVRYGLGFWALSAPPDPLQTEFTRDSFKPTYIRDSIESIKALQLIDFPVTDYENSYIWLSRFANLPTGQLAEKAIILSRTAMDFSGDISKLLLNKNPDGAFGGDKGYSSNILDTALASKALVVGGVDTSITAGTVSYLLATQNTDSGWGLVGGNGSHVYYTVIVMQALETQAQTPTIANALSHATAYLLSQQLPDGSWGNVPDTALALMAIAKTTGDTTVRLAALNWLISQQLPNGSWNDDVYSTALALQALAVWP